MMRHKQLEHRFGENIPERLEASILYVPIACATSTPSCCDCGEEVVTSFSPTSCKTPFVDETICAVRQRPSPFSASARQAVSYLIS